MELKIGDKVRVKDGTWLLSNKIVTFIEFDTCKSTGHICAVIKHEGSKAFYKDENYRVDFNELLPVTKLENVLL